jgi:hypothetical protein
MKEQFVPYEIALILKEKGFHEPCFCFYRENGQVAEGSICFGLLNNNLNDVYDYEKHQNPIRETIVTAPLWQQVNDWLREKHFIDILIDPAGIANMYSVFVKNWIYENEKDRAMFTYPEARQAAIEHALTLI